MNTSEQLKEQAIVNAYGDNYGEMVDENGWATYYSKFKERGGIEPFGEYDVIPLDLYTKKWRPLSLRGIENNNGWIRIEPDGSNLPTEHDEYNVFDAGHITRASYFVLDKLFVSKDYETLKSATHYKPIEELKKPIF